MSFDPDSLAAAVARSGAAVRVVVAAVEGSAPREPGAAMILTPHGAEGTIGGGALEWQAAARARALLAEARPWAREEMRLPLGPALGQCCGGAVRLVLERFGPAEIDAIAALRARGAAMFARPLAPGLPPADPGHDGPRIPLGARALARAARQGTAQDAPRLAGGWIAEAWARPARRLFLYGAGHVGRAVVRVLEGLDWQVVWVDDAPERFPPTIPPHAERLVAANPADAVALAGPDAAHLVMTYSHALDLEICHRILARPFRWAGLIGSDSKAARFRSRLRALGHGEAAIARLVCPIGDKALGKAPAAIAIGVAAQLLALGAGDAGRGAETGGADAGGADAGGAA
ncbi:MAG: xanthine dehydrogenase accessory protein XdhC [Paracoccaceae bacterium]|nr:MAG: xanthine dehydrogenase accessory protein XdhC [Paracoccaceae bacterium]